jgi:hypothetical protein
MSDSKKGSPVLAIAATALAITAIVYFVFLRGGTESQAAKPDPVTQPVAVLATKEVAPTKEDPLKTDPAPPAQDSAFRTIHELCDAGKWIEARSAIAKVFASEISDADRTELAGLATRAQDRILAALESQDVELYQIQTGDSLSKISGKFKQLKGCYGPILLLNGFKEPNVTLRLGQKLRIPRGSWSIVVDKTLFTLWICYEGVPLRRYPIAIGRDEKTPTGSFTVGIKNPKPAWYPPTEMISELKKKGVPIPIPYGHEMNPLGEYWVALDHKNYTGLGIHGTNDPASIGSKASNGCVRMDNKEVLMVAWTTWPGMIVTIVE